MNLFFSNLPMAAYVIYFIRRHRFLQAFGEWQVLILHPGYKFSSFFVRDLTAGP